MNVRLLIEYDGTDFCGWQKQPTGPSIQESLENVLFRVFGRRCSINGAGRTDSGVHAAGQVATFYAPESMDPERWAAIFNFHLPGTIRVLDSRRAPDTFHPQKDAIGKEYEYVLLNRPIGSALNRRALYFPRPLNWSRIREAIPSFLGEHDFKAFQGAKSTVKGTVRTITDFHLLDRGDGFHAFRVSGNGFLKQMVRSMVGTLIEIGLGKRDIGDVERILQSRDRRQAGHTAPPEGLTLIRVYYAGE